MAVAVALSLMGQLGLPAAELMEAGLTVGQGALQQQYPENPGAGSLTTLQGLISYSMLTVIAPAVVVAVVGLAQPLVYTGVRAVSEAEAEAGVPLVLVAQGAMEAAEAAAEQTTWAVLAALVAEAEVLAVLENQGMVALVGAAAAVQIMGMPETVALAAVAGVAEWSPLLLAQAAQA